MTITIEGNRVDKHSRYAITMPCHISAHVNGRHYDGRKECDSKNLIAMLPWVDLVADLNGVVLP